MEVAGVGKASLALEDPAVMAQGESEPALVIECLLAQVSGIKQHFP
jgi:hypothetical protein